MLVNFKLKLYLLIRPVNMYLFDNKMNMFLKTKLFYFKIVILAECYAIINLTHLFTYLIVLTYVKKDYNKLGKNGSGMAHQSSFRKKGGGTKNKEKNVFMH